MNFIKPRPVQGRSFGEQGKRAQQAARGGGARFQSVEGSFNSFYPREGKSLWWALCPTQSWSFELWNRETQEVEQYKDSFYLAYKEHRVVKSNRRFYCSAGPHKDKPCWGCGYRAHFFADLRETEERTGVRPKSQPGISDMLQFAMSGVLLESIAKVPAKNKDGTIRTKRDGSPIINDVPLALMDPAEVKIAKANGSTSFGLKTHWSVSSTKLNTLVGFDEELQNRCGSCGKNLYASAAACPKCGEYCLIVDEDSGPLSGQDLLEFRRNGLASCASCGYVTDPSDVEAKWQPFVECECGNPAEGKLIDFALRLTVEKTSDTSSVLKLVDAKPLHLFFEKNPAVKDLFTTPLELDKIFAPTPISAQTSLIPENMRGDGISPNPKKKESMAEPYPSAAGGGSEGESDDIPY